ncbi:hypothetical protein ASZ90_014194 [hydrocarbon metagenome]|jgi:hypothetical protein|uniref:Uncharacterized protein n=1 Tax=hydrocarbon metagenome TaxID=938273 RepID=A0A0W8F5H1_9ZZZZ
MLDNAINNNIMSIRSELEDTRCILSIPIFFRGIQTNHSAMAPRMD